MAGVQGGLGVSASRKLLVFVSSTFNDLKAERQAAVEAILKAGHIPAGMELFTAGDQSQLQTIYRWIDQCDVYMLILGGRYGSIEPESGKSYTELEYDYAKETGTPVFAVVATEDLLDAKAKELGREGFERENPKLLSSFREKVLSNISSFFSDKKDVRLCVYESLNELALDPNLSGWVSAREIPDSNDLLRQIEELRRENDVLRAKPSKVSSEASAGEALSFDELKEMLNEIKISVPAKIIKGATEDQDMDLFTIVVANSDDLIRGVTSSSMIGDTGVFYYRKVMPKLITHGLAVNEKVTGSALRRSSLNARGVDFVAWHERESFRKKAKS